MPVLPNFVWIFAGTRRVRINRVRGTINDVNAGAISFPPRDVRRKMLVSKGQASIVFLLKRVSRSARGGVSASPELLDEMVPLLVAGQLRELSTFLRRDDPTHIFIQPLLIFPILGTGGEHEYKR